MISVIIIFGAGIIYSAYFIESQRKLKIYNPADLNPSLVDSLLRSIRANHRISDFELVNQKGDTITQKNFEGKIYVADFFFTTCPSICPKMANQMKRVYDAYFNNDLVLFLSHTVMPETDSVSVLAEYAGKLNARADKWFFVTGDKKVIYELARKSYFAVTDEGTGDEHDFIHTENFILIDKNKRIRGFYDGTSEDDVDRLIEEMEILLVE